MEKTADAKLEADKTVAAEEPVEPTPEPEQAEENPDLTETFLAAIESLFSMNK